MGQWRAMATATSNRKQHKLTHQQAQQDSGIGNSSCHSTMLEPVQHVVSLSATAIN